MPLLGKIVVIKRNGGDGTEFPLTAACLFGRKLDCDIRIQLPQVSKEHCRIELNENKELILTNLSSVNPTRINGDVINQSERLKHGDLITIIDRSFRFEYPPPKTPKKKKLSIGQEKSTEENNSLLLGDKKKSELSFDTCLKDGSNLPQSVELLEKESSNKKDTMSPFGELYQMVKQDLATKSPWRSSLPKTPASRPQASQDVQRASTPVMTPTSKKRRSFKVQHEDETRTVDPPHQDTAEPEEISATVPFVVSSKPSVTKKTPDSQKKRLSKASEALSPASAVQKILFQAQPQSQKKSDLIAIQTPVQEVKMSPRTSPRSNAGKRFQAQDVLCEMKTATSASGKKGKTSANQQSDVQTKATLKRKRVSFGGQLSPELFDKRLPPDSPLRRGATPRRSLGLTQKPQSLLRRASTIGLLTQVKEKASVKTPSPKRAKAEAKTPSPFKTSLNATPTIASVEYQTPRTRGRFSVSRVISPSPIQDQEEESKADPSICATPKIPLKRKSLKSSAKKTPKSALKSALVVMHSRRSGASRANLKVLNSWADIVKFGQIKPQADVAKVKKTTKGRLVKKAVVPKAKTPTRRLRDSISTGHAASPATIVVGKAHLRTSQCVVAAPKVIPNITVFKKDIKMDEDFTGVPDIFKTPACSKSKNVFPLNNDWSEALSDETSVMKTPEESGEMMVSPLSVASTECGHYNNEAVTRLLQTQDGSLLGDEGLSEPSDEACTQESVSLEMPLSDQTEQSIPETIKTPNQKTAPSSGLTGIKRLMKTPKQKFEPIMDIRGKLLKTPKPHHKPPQEECLQGIKELMKTPKHRGVPVEDMIGVKQMMQTPKENNPILCAAGLQRLMKTPMPKSDQQEDLSGVKELLQTPIAQTVPEEKVFSLERSVETVEKEINGAGVQQPIQVPEVKRDGVEDDQTTDVQQLEDPEIIDTEVEKGLTGVQQLFKTPKHKGQAVEEHMGLKRLMQTPKEKVEVVEDLTGVKQLLKTPKQRSEPVTNQFVLQKLMKTPREKSVVVEEDFSGIKELFEEPENAGSVIASVTETEMKESESGSASTPVEGITENTVDENICLLENTETGISKESESSFDPSVPLLTEFPLLDQRFVSTVELINTCPSDAEEPRILEKTKETVEATPKQRSRTSVTRTQHSSQRTSIKKSNESIVVNEVLQLEPSVQEEIGSPLKSTRGRKGKTLQTVPQVSSVPYRKSSRGRTVKLGFDDVRDTTVDQVPVHTSVSETSDCLPEPSKARRGRKAAEVPTDVSSHVHAPDLKRGRRKLKAILETQSTEEHDISTTEKLSEEKDAPVNKISFKKESSAPVPAPRARRGRPQKTPCPILENKITNRVDFVAENSVTSAAKSVKGRMVKSTKKELSEELPLDDDCKMVEEAVQNKETKPQVVKSVRGRRAKQQKLMPTAEAEDQPAQDGSTSANVTDEPHQTVVKPSRGGRKTRQSSTKPSTEPEKISDAVVVPEDPPVLKTGRKRTIGTKGLDTEKEVRTTRGRRAVAEFPPPVAVASTRGRRAKAESAVPRLVPLDAVSESKQECSFSKQKTECVVEQAETQEKLRIGRRGKRILTDHPNCPAHGSIEVGVLKPAKSVKWSPEVIDSTDSNRTESSEDVKQPELKKSKRLGNFSVKKASDSSDQSCTQLAKTSRGRGAKKVENSTVDDSAKEALTKVKPLMRGKSTVSRVPVTEPSVKAYTPQKRKRNEVLETTADDGIQKEHLAKRRGRIINTQDSAELANKDENIEVSAEKDKAETKKQGRGGRGQKKTTPEVSSPQEAGSSAAVANTRKARSSNKVEVPKEALPVRRTRRK